MHVVAGLGNPGLEYQNTRHNAGFHALDILAEELHIRVTRHGMSGLYGDGIRNGERVILLKPQTYMNLSGDCVQKVLHFYKLPPENLIVMYDDIDLPVGSLRIRANGSAGTHNGMRSVVSAVGTEEFPRIRIGVGRSPGERGDLIDYVLGKPGQEESELLKVSFRNAAEAAVMILDGKLEGAQALFNKKHENKAPGRS